MESKPVSTKQKELSVTILIDNVSVCISTKRYNQLIEWIDRYNSYQIGLEIYPPESNIHKQYAIKYKIALETLKKLKNELQKETVSLNANAISNVIPTIHTNLNKIESRLEEINNRVEYINRVMNLLEKPTNLNQLKYLLKVIQIELDQL